MPRLASFGLLLAGVLLSSSCQSARSIPGDPPEIAAKGDWRHGASGIVIPERAGPFRRDAIYALEPDEASVRAAYHKRPHRPTGEGSGYASITIVRGSIGSGVADLAAETTAQAAELQAKGWCAFAAAVPKRYELFGTSTAALASKNYPPRICLPPMKAELIVFLDEGWVLRFLFERGSDSDRRDLIASLVRSPARPNPP